MELLTLLWLGKPVWMWLVFITIVLSLLVLDLGVFHKEDHEIGVAESLKMSAFYIALGISFSGFVWWQIGPTETAQYLTALERRLWRSMDGFFTSLPCS